MDNEVKFIKLNCSKENYNTYINHGKKLSDQDNILSQISNSLVLTKINDIDNESDLYFFNYCNNNGYLVELIESSVAVFNSYDEMNDNRNCKKFTVAFEKTNNDFYIIYDNETGWQKITWLTEINDLQQQVGELQQQVGELQQQVNDFESNLEDQTNDLESQILDLQRKNNSLESQVLDLQEQNDYLNSQINYFNSNLLIRGVEFDMILTDNRENFDSHEEDLVEPNFRSLCRRMLEYINNLDYDEQYQIDIISINNMLKIAEHSSFIFDDATVHVKFSEKVYYALAGAQGYDFPGWDSISAENTGAGDHYKLTFILKSDDINYLSDQSVEMTNIIKI